MGIYYSDSGFQFNIRTTYAVKRLLIANVVVFFLQQICIVLWKIDFLSLFAGLNPALVLRGMIWQPVTYMFLHHSIRHILFNMFALWMFGCSIEDIWGAKAFLKYYFITGVGAGLLSLIASIVTGSPNITVGASGAIFGILVAFGMMFPNRIILVFFLFPMRARNFVLLFAAIELWITVTAGPQAGGVARFAHIGGMLIGYIYLKYGDRIKYSIPRVRFNTGHREQRNAREWNDFMNEEVDPILDKIGREGIHSLTRKERSILKKARGRRRNGA